MFGSSSRRTGGKAARIRKLKSKIRKAEIKAAQNDELERLQKRWEKLRRS